MEPTNIRQGFSSALMVAKLPTKLSFSDSLQIMFYSVFFLSVATDLPLFCSSLSFSCFLSHFTLALIQSLSVGAVKWLWWLHPIPRELSYLDTFAICSPLAAESLAGSAAEECYFLLFLNLDLSFLLLPSLCVCVTFLMTPLRALCGVEWEQWERENCPLNLWREEKKLSGGSKSLWLNPAPSDCSFCVGLNCVLSVIRRMLTDCYN